MFWRSAHILSNFPHKTGQPAKIQECHRGRQHRIQTAPSVSSASLQLHNVKTKQKWGGTLLPKCLLRIHKFHIQLTLQPSLSPLARKPRGTGSAQWLNPLQLRYNHLILATGCLELRPPRWPHCQGGWSLKQKAGNRKCVPFVTETRMQT